VFASTRQLATQAILLNEGPHTRPSPTIATGHLPAARHERDGTGMHQIASIQPRLRPVGAVERSDRVLALGVTNGTTRSVSTGAIRTATDCSSSTAPTATHGRKHRGHNDNVIQFLNARQRPTASSSHRPSLFGTQLGGDTLVIDANDFVEFDQ